MKMNWKLFIPTMALLLTALSAQAQVDVKVSPFGLLFSRLVLRAEFPATENIGVEVFGGTIRNLFDFDEGDVRFSNFMVGANGRYYFNPDQGIDRFYVGAYTKYRGGGARNEDTDEKLNVTNFAVGTLIGYKAVSKSEKLVVDFNVGFGRALISKIDGVNGGEDIDISDVPILNWDIPILVGIGYRF